MALARFYETIGGDIEEVRARLLTDERIEKFVRAFADDATFASLTVAFEQGDAEGAFRAAHTLKGIGRDLGFAKLQTGAAELTDALRASEDGTFGSLAEAATLFERVSADHAAVMAALVHLDG